MRDVRYGRNDVGRKVRALSARERCRRNAQLSDGSAGEDRGRGVSGAASISSSASSFPSGTDSGSLVLWKDDCRETGRGSFRDFKQLPGTPVLLGCP